MSQPPASSPNDERYDSFKGIVMDPYIEAFHGDVCPQCANRGTNQCPCPLDCLLLLAVQAIEAVDDRRQRFSREAVTG